MEREPVPAWFRRSVHSAQARCSEPAPSEPAWSWRNPAWKVSSKTQVSTESSSCPTSREREPESVEPAQQPAASWIPASAPESIQ
jgi:hypothetical protein